MPHYRIMPLHLSDDFVDPEGEYAFVFPLSFFEDADKRKRVFNTAQAVSPEVESVTFRYEYVYAIVDLTSDGSGMPEDDREEIRASGCSFDVDYLPETAMRVGHICVVVTHAGEFVKVTEKHSGVVYTTDFIRRQ